MIAPKLARHVVWLCALGCAHAGQTSEAIRSQILEVESQRRQAQLRGDWKTIAELNAAEFIDIGGNGVMRTAAQNAEDMRSGRLRFDSVEVSDQLVRSYDDVAIVTGEARRIGSYDGAPFRQRIRYTRMYAREPGGWRAVFAQNTRIDTASAVNAVAAGGAAEAEILHLRQKLRAAYLAADAAALDSILADDWLSTSSRGEITTKAELLARQRTGQRRMLALDYDDIKVRVYGDAAVETGGVRSTLAVDGRAVTSLGRYTIVWVKRQGRWQVVAHHFSNAEHAQGDGDARR